jgi:uncharacterized repeat protein (TIGR03803 family)
VQTLTRRVPVVALTALCLCYAPGAAAQTMDILWSFQGGTDGEYPVAGLVADSQGNLYGTTKSGGSSTGCGTVFEVRYTTFYSKYTLWSFQSTSSTDGCSPYAGVIVDSSGNVYGTTNAGGLYGYGIVFELTPSGDSRFTEKILWNFGSGEDGRSPAAGLVVGASGQLFGTTTAGGRTGCMGTVFELLPGASGTWTESVLHSFGCTPSDGSMPVAAVSLDSDGKGLNSYCTS